MNLIKSISAILFALNISGCASEPPKCADSSTIGLIENIFFSNFEENIRIAGGDPEIMLSAIKENASFSVTNIRTEGYDKDARKYSCSSDVVLNLDKTPESQEAINSLSKVINYETSSHGISEKWKEYGRQAIAASIGFTEIPDLSGIQINGTSITRSISYTSTISESPGEDDKQYLEAIGITPVVNAAFALSASGAFPHDYLTGKEFNTADDCVDYLIAEFRREHGEEAMIRTDVMQEWSQKCESRFPQSQ